MRRLILWISGRPRRALAALMILGTVATAGLAHLRFDSSLESLSMPDDPAREAHRRAREMFGDEEIGIALLVDEDVYRPEALETLRRLTSDLQKVPGVSSVLSIANALDSAADLAMPPPLVPPGPVTDAVAVQLRDRAEANPLYVPHLVARDGRAVAVLLFLAPAASSEAEAIVDDAVAEVLAGYAGEAAVHYTGMSHVRVQAVRLMRADLAFFLPISLLLMAVVLFAVFRSVRAALLPLFSVVLGVASLMGLMGWFGTPVTMTTLVLPSLLLVIGGSYSVHVVSAHMEGEDSEQVVTLADTLDRVGLPIVVSAFTTAVGFGSLALHPIPAIAGLGKYAVVGIVVVASGCLFGVPLTLQVLPLRRVAGESGPGRLEACVLAIGRWALARRYTVFAAAFVLSLVAAAGAVHVRPDTDFLKAFRPGTPVRMDHAIVAERLVAPTPLSVIVEAPEAGYFRAIAPLRRIADFQDFLESLDTVDETVSLVDYLRTLDLGLQAAPGELTVGEDGSIREAAPAPSFRDAPSEQLPQIFAAVAASPATFSGVVDSEFRRLHLTVRTAATGARDTEVLSEQIQAYASAMFPIGVKTTVTGSLVIMSEASRRILGGQLESIVIAFAVILVALIVMFLSVRVAVAAMLPNILPVGVFFGFMGWCDIELNLATSIIGAVALGIGVDDTIHYMARLNRTVKHTHSQQAALLETLADVARPVVTTSLALTAGFLVIAASRFTPLSAFGSLAAMAMVVALLTNVILLPAVLATVPVVSVWDLVSARLGPSPHMTIPLFRGLGAMAVRLIVLLGRVRRFERGEALAIRGEEGREMYLMLEGEAEVLLAGGKSVSLARGGLVGEMGLLRGSPRGADVRAVTAVDALEIDEDFLRRLRVRYPRLAAVFFLNIARILSDRLEAANRRAVDKTPS